jgi:hypothetical protein
MFNGQESIADQWTNPNITGAVPWPILVSGGGVPPLLVLICLLVWALGCLGLGLAYGARKRWADTFNGIVSINIVPCTGLIQISSSNLLFDLTSRLSYLCVEAIAIREYSLVIKDCLQV